MINIKKNKKNVDFSYEIWYIIKATEKFSIEWSLKTEQNVNLFDLLVAR